MEVFDNLHITGSLSMKAAAIPANTVGDAAIADAADILATKCEQDTAIEYWQSNNQDVVDETKLVHIARLPETVKSVTVTPIIAPVVVTPHVVITRVQAGRAARNEKQQVTLYGTPTGGNFKITVTAKSSTQQTANIAYNANAAAVQSALEALSNVDPGDVTVTGGSLPGNPIVVEFTGTLAATDIAMMSIQTAGLTGGSVAVAVATTTTGAAGRNERQYVSPRGTGSPVEFTIYRTGTVSGGTFNFTIDGETITNVPYNVTPVEFLDLVFAGTSWTPAKWNYSWIYCDTGFDAATSVWAFLGAAGATSHTVSIDSTNLTGGGNYTASISGSGGTYSMSGNFRLAFNGQETADLSVSATLSDVQTALRALTTINGNNVDVVDWVSGECSLAVRFTNSLGGRDVLYQLDFAAGHRPTGAVSAYANTYVDGTGTDEVQTLTLSGAPGTGTAAITFNGQTAAFNYNESAATAQTKLRALSSIAGSNVNVTGSWPGTLTVTFVLSLGATNVNQMTVDDALIKSSVTTTQTAITPLNEKQSIAITGDIAGGTFTLSFDLGGNQTTAACAYNLSNATLDTRLEDLSNIAGGDITVTLGTLPTTAVLVEFGGTLAAQSLNLLTTNDSGLTPASPFYTVDVGVVSLRSPAFASSLSAPITVNPSSAARTPVSATIAAESLDISDQLVVRVDAQGTSANPGAGLHVIIHTQWRP